jgi:hypothetical protein
MGNPTTAVFITDISNSSPIVKFRYNIGSTYYYFTAVVTVVASDGNRISSDGLFSRYSSINDDFNPVDPSDEFTDANDSSNNIIRNYIGYFIIIRPQGGGGLEESTQIRWPLYIDDLNIYYTVNPSNSIRYDLITDMSSGSLILKSPIVNDLIGE